MSGDSAGGAYFDPQEVVREAIGAEPLTGGIIWPPGYSVPPPGHEIPAQQGETLGQFLDPVRAAALHEAVQHEAHRMRPPPDDEAIGRVIAAAKMFEAWLQGPAVFDRYLAEDDQASGTP